VVWAMPEGLAGLGARLLRRRGAEAAP